MGFGNIENTTTSYTPKPVDQYMFRRGKHSGKTFKYVAENDPDFCAWVKTNSKLTGAMGTFREYLIGV